MDTAEVIRKKDQILEDVLFKLKDSSFVKTMILQGGGALHFVYSSPRYSGDLDFVDFSLGENPQKYLEDMTAFGQRIYLINKVKTTKFGVRAKWGYTNGQLATVEIEPKSALEYDQSEGKFKPFLVKTPKEIYKDKIFANICRCFMRQEKQSFPFKANDLFDLEYLTQNLNVGEVTLDEIKEKANDFQYARDELGTDPVNLVNNDILNTIVNLVYDEKNHDLIRDSFRKSILPDVFKLFNFDSAYFKKVAEHFAKYRSA